MGAVWRGAAWRGVCVIDHLIVICIAFACDIDICDCKRVLRYRFVELHLVRLLILVLHMYISYCENGRIRFTLFLPLRDDCIVNQTGKIPRLEARGGQDTAKRGQYMTPDSLLASRQEQCRYKQHHLLIWTPTWCLNHEPRPRV